MDKWLPALIAIGALVALGAWLTLGPAVPLVLREPTAPAVVDPAADPANVPVAGRLIPGPGQPADLPGSWPGFRGAQRDGIAHAAPALAVSWTADGPPRCWQIEVGEGYAGVAVLAGRVYLHDYDQPAQQDAIRCLSLADGREIWRFARPAAIKRNHGMSRTVPAVTEQALVALNPKCFVTCLDPVTGAQRWTLDLVAEYGARVPPWYAGQCPLIDGNRVVLAPCGSDLLVALDPADGKVLWRTPNLPGWKMTHASIVPMDLAGRRTYVYCGSGGVIGVDAATGQELWRTSEWKISIATIASPVPVGPDRLFLAGGYDSGCLMLQIIPQGSGFAARPLFRLDADRFGATQQTPILQGDHLYGVRPDGELVCLDLQGNLVWQSGAAHRFGLGPFLLADRRLFVVDDSCRLTLCDADPARFQLRAQVQLLAGHDAWGPLALAGDRLLVRDLTRLICLQVGAQ